MLIGQALGVLQPLLLDAGYLDLDLVLDLLILGLPSLIALPESLLDCVKMDLYVFVYVQRGLGQMLGFILNKGTFSIDSRSRHALVKELYISLGLADGMIVPSKGCGGQQSMPLLIGGLCPPSLYISLILLEG